MALDYHQKKQVNKNRPRKRPVKLLLFLILGGIVFLYGLGIATGWLVFKYLPQKKLHGLANSAKPEETEQAPPAPAQTAAKSGRSALDNDPDLTFYYTLPKGDKGVIGSGINNLPPQTATRIAPPKTNNSALQQHRAAETTVTASPAKNESGKATYTVQVAAYNEKSDAQELKAKLQKIGIASRIEEYTVPGKGIWYRVRSGNKLDRVNANKIAAKLGNNAILIEE
jgi:cell division septation protein DedD